MKLVRGIVLFNSVFSGPTRPPTDVGIAPICPTACIDVLKRGNGELNRGARPDFEDDCDMDALYSKCLEEDKVST